MIRKWNDEEKKKKEERYKFSLGAKNRYYNTVVVVCRDNQFRIYTIHSQFLLSHV